MKWGKISKNALARKGVAHIQLLHFSGYDVVVDTCLARHLIGKRNALALCGKHNVMLGGSLAKLLCASLGKLNVTKKKFLMNLLFLLFMLRML